MPHVIRLRGQWEAVALGGGSVRLARRFHRPTGLNAGSKVWLVIESVDSDAEVVLNGNRIGQVTATAGEGRFEIAAAMGAVNLVEITLQAGDRGQPGIGLVKLEIEESVDPGQGKDFTRRRGGAEG